MNGVRSWQLIIKHDLTNWFIGQTLGVRSSVRVKHRCEDLLVKGVRSLQLTIKHDLTHRFHDGHLVSAPVAANFWSQGPLLNGVRSWQLIIKHDLTHRFHHWTLGVHPSVPAPHRLRHRCGTGPLLEPGSTCEWCQNMAIDYKT